MESRQEMRDMSVDGAALMTRLGGRRLFLYRKQSMSSIGKMGTGSGERLMECMSNGSSSIWGRTSVSGRRFEAVSSTFAIHNFDKLGLAIDIENEVYFRYGLALVDNGL